MIVVLQETLQRPAEKTARTGGISHQSWQQEASDRNSLLSSVRKTRRKFEAERHEAAKKKTLEAERTSSILIILGPNLRLSKMQ